MVNSGKTIDELIAETGELRRRIEELEYSEIERKLAVDALTESEEKYRNLVERANNGILIVQDGEIKYVNPRLAEIAGATVKELTDKAFIDFIHPDEMEKVVGRYMKRMAGEDVEPIYETTLVRKNGSYVDVELNAGVITYLGEPADLVFVRDITSHREMETEREEFFNELEILNTELEKANRLKDEILANTSHELRTPLTKILGNLKLVLDHLYEDEDEMEEFIKMAYKDTQSLSTIINSLLEMSRIQSGYIDVELTEIDVQELVDDIQLIFGLNLKKKGIELGFDLNGVAGGTIRCDRKILSQILNHLMSNAVKFTKEGKIMVGMKVEEDHDILFWVEDTGVGIDPAIVDNPFKPFVQLDGSATRRFGGTGMGLAVSKSLVELMGGTITLESEGEGKGTRVSFSIPNKGNETE
jgi:PAS domain S-box-containing protein